MQQFNPMQYMAIDVANCLGMDKLLWDERIQFVKDNISCLEYLIPENPKEKYLAVKAVKNFRLAQKGIPVNHIMALDSTNSGVQIMSLLTLDSFSASACNLIFTGKREDLYQSVLNQLKGVKLSRQQIKEVIIPMLYGSKMAPSEAFGEGTKQERAFIAAVEAAVPALSDCRDIITDCWDSDAKFHSWVLPDGHTAYCPVLESFDYKVEAEELSERFTFVQKEVEPSTNSTSLLANVIHSLDAYIVREMVRRLYKLGIQLGVIHDSFWASPIHMQVVRETYLQILVEMVHMDLLNDIVFQLTGEKDTIEYDEDRDEFAEKVANAEYALS